jgi:hypothetical protein
MKTFNRTWRAGWLVLLFVGLAAFAVVLPGGLLADAPADLANSDRGLGARWQAMADFYAKKMEGEVLRAAEAFAIRSQAMDAFYRTAGDTSLNTPASALEARSLAWDEYYGRQQAREAAQALHALAVRSQGMNARYGR